MGTQIEMHDGSVVAKRLARSGGPVTVMSVTVAEWERMKGRPMIRDDGGDEATGEQHVADMMAEFSGTSMHFMSAAEWNAQARDMECSRHAAMMGAKIADARRRAREAIRSTMRVVA